MIQPVDFQFALDSHRARTTFESPDAVIAFFAKFGADFSAYRQSCDTIRDDKLPRWIEQHRPITPELLWNGAFLDGFVIGALAARYESWTAGRN